MKLPTPTLTEQFEPERSTLTLSIEKVAIKSGDKKVAIKSGDKSDTIKTGIQKNQIVRYLTDHAEAKSSEISTLLEISLSRVKVILSEMIADGIVVAEGNNRNRRYRLKS